MLAQLCNFQSSVGAVVCATLAIAVVYPPACSAAEPETLETVLAVWRKREAGAKTVKVVMAEESMTGETIGLEGELVGGTAKMQRVIVLDGTNMRHERAGQMWNRGSKEPDQVTDLSVIDGHRAKELSKVGRDDGASRSNGRISNRDKHRDVLIVHMSPVLRHWRPLSPALNPFKVDELKLVSTEEKIGGDRCILIQEPYGMFGGIRKYWIAPGKDMAIVRTIVLRGETLLNEVNVSFKDDAKLGWVPEKWKSTSYRNDGRAMHSATHTVTDIEINLDVPPGTFDIVFPPGTEVYDSIAKAKFFVPLEK